MRKRKTMTALACIAHRVSPLVLPSPALAAMGGFPFPAGEIFGEALRPLKKGYFLLLGAHPGRGQPTAA